jgi:hypothetical protein
MIAKRYIFNRLKVGHFKREFENKNDYIPSFYRHEQDFVSGSILFYSHPSAQNLIKCSPFLAAREAG